ncbi:hypothetical protein [Halomicrobium urmianum]|uniref:hypothetical protein n=1 Tax=Halomicrobium urmianum TaxID=1586233 RepID=UPI001CD95813|nr:hypothetical protein [Halomicrobium urmianum]
MWRSTTRSGQGDIEDRRQQVGRFTWILKAGFGTILAAFPLTAAGSLPANLDGVASPVEAVLLPLIFVGVGLLLFGPARTFASRT